MINNMTVGLKKKPQKNKKQVKNDHALVFTFI